MLCVLVAAADDAVGENIFMLLNFRFNSKIQSEKAEMKAHNNGVWFSKQLKYSSWNDFCVAVDANTHSHYNMKVKTHIMFHPNSGALPCTFRGIFVVRKEKAMQWAMHAKIADKLSLLTERTCQW